MSGRANRAPIAADTGQPEGEAILPGRKAELAQHQHGKGAVAMIRPFTMMVLKNNGRSVG